ncbi:hypothetical protein [Kocuria marina]|uniref:hypothetical protein n=1 Tax=Kocuria marina TaxID=223184 RepID=UPI0011A7C588|nr:MULTISPECIES: hypothetical protein [Kocuria]MCT2020013.1 hypothetical protein [Kocuria marina]
MALLRIIEDGRALVSTEGTIAWNRKGPTVLEGHLPVSIAADGCDAAYLGMTLWSQRPSQIGLRFMMNSVPVLRVDVNGKHDSLPRSTHSHRYNAMTGKDDRIEILDNFVDVPMAPTIPLGTERKCFEVFANMANVQLNGTYWTDPWRGGR